MIQLTDKELADPVYMRAYCEQSDADFSVVIQSRERLRKAAQSVLDNVDRPWSGEPADGIKAIEELRKELAE